MTIRATARVMGRGIPGHLSRHVVSCGLGYSVTRWSSGGRVGQCFLIIEITHHRP